MNQISIVRLLFVLSLFSLMIESAFAAATPPSTPTQSRASRFGPPVMIARRGESIDFNIDLGIAPWIPILQNPTFSSRLSLRADLGFLWIREPAYIGLGLTGGILPSQSAGLGPYVSIAHLGTGLWASTALMVNALAQPVFALSAGWSILGTEIQVWPAGGFALIGKLRIPIGLPIWAVLFDRKMARQRH